MRRFKIHKKTGRQEVRKSKKNFPIFRSAYLPVNFFFLISSLIGHRRMGNGECAIALGGNRFRREVPDPSPSAASLAGRRRLESLELGVCLVTPAARGLAPMPVFFL